MSCTALQVKSAAPVLLFQPTSRRVAAGDAELARFLQIAMSSASELDYHLLLARDLNFVNSGDYEQLANELTEVRRMLNSFIQKLRANS
jgi:four helix bundle protein